MAIKMISRFVRVGMSFTLRTVIRLPFIAVTIDVLYVSD